MGACVFVTCVPRHNYMKVFTSHSEHFQLLMKKLSPFACITYTCTFSGGGGQEWVGDFWDEFGRGEGEIRGVIRMLFIVACPG